MSSSINLLPPAAEYEIKSFVFPESFHFQWISRGGIQDTVRLTLSDTQDLRQQVLQVSLIDSSVLSASMSYSGKIELPIAKASAATEIKKINFLTHLPNLTLTKFQ
jgi:hypothetical protein